MQAGRFDTELCHTKEQTANVLTKVLPHPKHQQQLAFFHRLSAKISENKQNKHIPFQNILSKKEWPALSGISYEKKNTYIFRVVINCY